MGQAQTLTRIGIVVTIAAILVTLVVALSGEKDSITNALGGKPEVSCVANLGGPLDTAAGDVTDINSVSCYRTGDTCVNLLSVSPLSLTRAEGTVIFDAGDVAKPERFEVSRFGGAFDVSQKLCTNSNSVTVKLLGSSGAIVNSKAVQIT